MTDDNAPHKDFSPDFAPPAEWAAMYRTFGIQIVPCYVPRAGFVWKRPALSEWKTFQDELVPDALFNKWYGERGEFVHNGNMGILCGKCSNNIFAIDLDDYKTQSAAEWWRGVLALNNHGFEPETWQQRTGGGGRQLYFRAPPGWTAPTNRTPIGVDIRGQGGFAVLPPSKHESGKEYAWIYAPWETDIEVAPAWLCEAIDKLVAEHSETRTKRERTANPEGDFNEFGARVDGREEYMTKLIWAAVIDLWCQCPIKPDHAARDAAYETYERAVKARIYDPSASKRDLLEREGRGHSLFAKKWDIALSKWDDEVAEAGRKKQAEQGAKAAAEPSDDPGPFPASELKGTAPKRRWIVNQWIAEGVVNSLYGAGGIGKTLLAQQLAYCLNSKRDFLGIPVERKSVLCVLCEDTRDEIHRRHDALLSGLGLSMGPKLEHVWLWPRVGYDNLLVTWDVQGRPQVSPQFQAVLTAVLSRRADLLILDTLADMYGGNEIVRVQANHFIKAVLGRLIVEAAKAGFVLTVLLLAHPSTAGTASGTGLSGSTAWENAVRSRLLLRSPEEGDADERELTRMKANYANAGEETTLRLRYQDGYFVVAQVDENSVALRSAKQHVLDAVRAAWEHDRPFVGKKGHKRHVYTGIPASIAQFKISRAIVAQAIRELIEDGEIELKRGHRKHGYKVRGDDDE